MLRRRGLVRTVGRTAVIAGTATAVSGHVARNQQARQAEAAQAAAEEAPAPPPPAPAPDGGSLVEQLQGLADLRDRGVLTDEEFATQKARLLGSA